MPANSIKASLLLVDDDRHVLQSMSVWLRDQGYRVDTATGKLEAQALIDRKSYDVALVDVRLQDGDGFELLAECRRRRPEMPVILITGYGSVDAAVEALRAGAFDFLTKPLIDDELALAIQRCLHQREVVEENRNLKAQLDMRYGLENIVGRDHRMVRIFDVIEAVADTKATVLITGESGTGKSLIARAIHRRSSRRDKPFVEVACGALPETLLESELFGHVAGAFTGATGEKIGKFQLAHGGTIFLDEIGTASPALQVKLLRVLQDYQFERVGGTQTFTADVRVILATNEDLQRAVNEGRFRRDLYYRINVINIELPPLRERVADIPLLADHFLREICEQMGRPVKTLSPEAAALLQTYRWPGNARELQNVLERAVLLGRGPAIEPEDLPAELLTQLSGDVSAADAAPLKQALQLPERQIILQVLEMNGWNRQAAAKALGINRTTLYKKMKRLGIEAPRSEAKPLPVDPRPAPRHAAGVGLGR